MCVAIPSKIIKIENGMATVDAEGARRDVSLLLLDDAKIGDYVIVHAGFAIQIIDEEAALESIQLLKEVLYLSENGPSDTEG